MSHRVQTAIAKNIKLRILFLSNNRTIFTRNQLWSSSSPLDLPTRAGVLDMKLHPNPKKTKRIPSTVWSSLFFYQIDKD